MPWTETTRAQYRREGLRYASDTTDAEWAIISPLLPPPSRLGRPRKVDPRAVLDGISVRASVRLPMAHGAEGLPGEDQLCSAISNGGETKACWHASTTSC